MKVLAPVYEAEVLVPDELGAMKPREVYLSINLITFIKSDNNPYVVTGY
jgi:hypothetical protein